MPRPADLGDPGCDARAWAAALLTRLSTCRTQPDPARLSCYRRKDHPPAHDTELDKDSLYSHLAWMRAIRDVFDVEVRFPVVEDPSMVVGRTYGMIEEGATNTAGVRATYFIDPEGVIRAITHYPLTIGRSVDEILRMVAALQATYSGARLAPADWRQKQPLLLPADEEAQQEANWFCRSEL
jgi:peroxiredoxin 2/4